VGLKWIASDNAGWNGGRRGPNGKAALRYSGFGRLRCQLLKG
jgi:hypothetical protein